MDRIVISVISLFLIVLLISYPVSILLVAIGFYVLWMSGMLNRQLNISSILGGLVETPKKLYQPIIQWVRETSLNIWRDGQAGILGRDARRTFTGSEAARQRAGTRGGFWDTLVGMIFNPAGMQNYREGLAKRNVANQLPVHAARDVDHISTSLDVLAQRYAPGDRTWTQLSQTERDAITGGTATDAYTNRISWTERLRAQREEVSLHRAQSAVRFYLKEAYKERDFFEMGDIDELGEDLSSNDAENILKSAIDLIKIVRSPRGTFSDDEKEKALEYLRDNAEKLRNYGISVPR